MRTLISRISCREGGLVVSAELVLIATIAVLAMIVAISEVGSSPDQVRAQVSSTIEIMPQPYDFSRLCRRDEVRTGASYC
jgi:hypothetical protein